jgi:hypothetical protein
MVCGTVTNHPFKTPGSYQRQTGYQYSADVNSVDADSKTASTRLMPARNTCYQRFRSLRGETPGAQSRVDVRQEARSL